MKDIRLGISVATKKAYVGELDKLGIFKSGSIEVTEDFKRSVVYFCSESIEFEVDGMKFKATCERIE